MIWHSSSQAEVLTELGVDDKTGLANGVALQRLEENGQNIIAHIERPGLLKRFAEQLKSKTVIMLIVTALVSFAVSFMYDSVNAYSALLIIAIVALNALISAYHIYNCDNTLDGIKQNANPTVTVLREGILKSVNSAVLVPGDVIILEEGDYIPADARIIEANEFRCNESVLTGVEVPVEKNADITFEDITPIEKRSNIVFSATSVVHGSAKAVVFATGLNTEIGRSTALLQQTGEDKLPLQGKLDNIGKIVNIAILAVCAVVFLIGMLQNFSSGNFAAMTLEMLMNSVALAVAAIPEGLPAITTIVTAMGIQRIFRDKIFVKDASAAELLGKTDVICCDKTGVLTRNKMLLSHIYDGKTLNCLERDGITESTATVLKIATVCSTLQNDSTEYAIEKGCLAYNSMSKKDIENMFPHISEIPFDSERKCMTVITMINETPFAVVKGAPELLIPKCVGCDGEKILEINEKMADEALRIVCVAMRPLEGIPANPNPDEIECELTFVGLLGLEDPPREGVEREIAACDEAGIKTVMITGDNLTTAATVARRIGILKENDICVTGEELSAMSDDELAEKIEQISVFARISPNDKLRIVKAWQKKKKIVTVTGDSVSDAESLALADVGCAIGKFGADVAKGNADIIISDNRFDSVIRAVKESRGLFANIKKSVNYLFSCNFAEIISVLFGMLIFKSAPLAAVQLLWINLLTDSAPAISLSMESADKDIMKHKPLSSSGGIFSFKSVLSIMLQSLFIAAVTLISYSLGNDFGDTATAMTMAFATLGISQLFHCFNSKLEGSLFGNKLFANKFMNYSVCVTLFVILFLVCTPAGYLFGLKILSASRLLISILLSFAVIPFTEAVKLLMRKI